MAMKLLGGHSRYEVVNQITFNQLTFSLSTKPYIEEIYVNGMPFEQHSARIFIIVNVHEVEHKNKKTDSLRNSVECSLSRTYRIRNFVMNHYIQLTAFDRGRIE